MLIYCVVLQTAPLNVFKYTPRDTVLERLASEHSVCPLGYLNSPEARDFSISPGTFFFLQKRTCDIVMMKNRKKRSSYITCSTGEY
jgi:hypothetical protein